MSKYRMVKTDFWIDEYIESLNHTEKYLFIYFLTSPETNILGIYKTSLKRIGYDTGLNKEELEIILAKFSKDNKIHFFEGYIFITNFLKHQKPNKTMKIGIKRLVESLPENLIKLIKTSISDRLYIAYIYPSIHINNNKNKNKDKNSEFEEKKVGENQESSPIQAPSKPLASPLDGPSKDLASPLNEQALKIIKLSNDLFSHREGFKIDENDFHASDVIKLRIKEFGYDKVKSAIKFAKENWFDSKKMYMRCQWETLFRDHNISSLAKESKLQPPSSNKNSKYGNHVPEYLK